MNRERVLTETDDKSAFDVTPASIEDGRNDRLGVEVRRLTTLGEITKVRHGGMDVSADGTHM